MSTINQYKEQEAPPTPLFLFDCLLGTGVTERWSTHEVTVNGNAYSPRLLQHNLFNLQASSADGVDGAQRISLTLANADSHYSQIERETGFKGAKLTIQFAFYDLVANAVVSETKIIFTGAANPPDEITESSCCDCEGQSWVWLSQYRSIEALLEAVAGKNVFRIPRSYVPDRLKLKRYTFAFSSSMVEELRAMRQERPDEIAVMLIDDHGHFTTAASRQEGEVSKKTMLAIAKAPS